MVLQQLAHLWEPRRETLRGAGSEHRVLHGRPEQPVPARHRSGKRFRERGLNVATGTLTAEFMALHWLAGFLILDDQIEPRRAAARRAFDLARASGVDHPVSFYPLARALTVHGETDTAARLAGFEDGYADQAQLSLYGFGKVIRNRLVECLHCAMGPEECQATMAAGAERAGSGRPRPGSLTAIRLRSGRLRVRVEPIVLTPGASARSWRGALAVGRKQASGPRRVVILPRTAQARVVRACSAKAPIGGGTNGASGSSAAP